MGFEHVKLGVAHSAEVPYADAAIELPPEDHGVELLTLRKGFEPGFTGWNARKGIDIFVTLRGRDKITAFGCYCYRMSGGATGLVQETWKVSSILRGDHVLADDKVFEKARVYLRLLPSQILNIVDPDDDRPTAVFTNLALDANATLDLKVKWDNQGAGREIKYTRRAFFELTFKAPQSVTDINSEYAEALRSLIAICLRSEESIEKIEYFRQSVSNAATLTSAHDKVYPEAVKANRPIIYPILLLEPKDYKAWIKTWLLIKEYADIAERLSVESPENVLERLIRAVGKLEGLHHTLRPQSQASEFRSRVNELVANSLTFKKAFKVPTKSYGAKIKATRDFWIHNKDQYEVNEELMKEVEAQLAFCVILYTDTLLKAAGIRLERVTCAEPNSEPEVLVAKYMFEHLMRTVVRQLGSVTSVPDDTFRTYTMKEKVQILRRAVLEAVKETSMIAVFKEKRPKQ